MKIQLALLGLGLALTACQHSNPTNLPPGTYNSTKTSTDANGTEYQSKTTTTVSQNPDGTKSATVHNTNTQDPQGLFNKQTTSETVKTY